nr:hypothetical protein [Bacteroidota bacterium]
MLAYKIRSRIDEKGNMSIHNLPYKNRESVEVILLINDKSNFEEDKNPRIELLKASFGTIESEVHITDSMLQRENLYENDGR